MANEIESAEKQIGQVLLIPRRRIRPFKDQPRNYFDPGALKELAASIKATGGNIVEIKVRRIKNDPEHDYELIDGQRRWLACQTARVAMMRAVVVESVEDHDEQFVQSILANSAREPHSTLEIAHAIARLRKHPKYSNLPAMAQNIAIGELFGRSFGWVYDHECILRLQPEVQELLHPKIEEQRRLKMAVAKLLCQLPIDAQKNVAYEIVDRELGVSQAKALIKRYGQIHQVDFKTRQIGPQRAYERIEGAVSTIRSEAERLLMLKHTDFERAFNARSKEQIESTLNRVESCMSALDDLRSVLKRYASRNGAPPLRSAR